MEFLTDGPRKGITLREEVGYQKERYWNLKRKLEKEIADLKDTLEKQQNLTKEYYMRMRAAEEPLKYIITLSRTWKHWEDRSNEEGDNSGRV